MNTNKVGMGWAATLFSKIRPFQDDVVHTRIDQGKPRRIFEKSIQGRRQRQARPVRLELQSCAHTVLHIQLARQGQEIF